MNGEQMYEGIASVTGIVSKFAGKVTLVSMSAYCHEDRRYEPLFDDSTQVPKSGIRLALETSNRKIKSVILIRESGCIPEIFDMASYYNLTVTRSG